MVGEVTLKDEKCKKCPLIRLSVRTLYVDDIPVYHTLICEHEEACERMEYICEKEKQ